MRRPTTIADGTGRRVAVWPCPMCGAWMKSDAPSCGPQCEEALEVREALTPIPAAEGRLFMATFKKTVVIQGRRFKAGDVYKMGEKMAKQAVNMGAATAVSEDGLTKIADSPMVLP